MENISNVLFPRCIIITDEYDLGGTLALLLQDHHRKYTGSVHVTRRNYL